MIGKVILISGPVGVGKSTLAITLEERLRIRRFRTSALLEERLQRDGAALDRKDLQDEGERLDKQTSGEWVANELSRVVAVEEGVGVTVDSVRIVGQITAIRRALGRRVAHVHLTAATETLVKRYKRRRSPIRELADYAMVRKNATEAQVESLASHADLVIDTSEYDPEDVFVLVASWLRLYSGRDLPLVDVLVGGQYGSEGKGNIASYLAKEYDLLVRVGGPNAGHKVKLESKIVTHHQLPSGTNTSNARLLIGPGAVLNVASLQKEIAESNVDARRLSIDPNAMTISEEDIAEEKELMACIGSTGQGVGAATARRIMGRCGGVQLAGDIAELKPYLRAARDVLDEVFSASGRVFLEGTQGTALSLYHGPYPYVTSRDTTVSGCLAEAGISPTRVRRVIMVCRTFPIRVESPTGRSSGPMKGEISLSEIAAKAGLDEAELKAVERTSTTNRARRIARFDWSLLSRATSLNAPTDIALTFADYISATNAKARRYEQLTLETMAFVEQVERVASAPVSLISTRFHYHGIIDRRAW